MSSVHATPEHFFFLFITCHGWGAVYFHSCCLSRFPVVIHIFLVRSLLTIWIAHHSREIPTRPRRVSVSSTEENLDLEASLASIGRSFPAPVPEGDETGTRQSVNRSGTRDGESLARSRSQTVGVRGIANRLRSGIASLGSPHTPVSGGGETIWTSKKTFATDAQLLFKRRITNLYVQVSALRSYVELNYSGFRKVLKK